MVPRFSRSLRNEETPVAIMETIEKADRMDVNVPSNS
jgi:hypothetical protein